MATYLIAREITITRQEGDVADIVITVPAALSMTARTPVFQVRDTSNRAIINKTTPAITVQAQVINIPLLPADTKGKPGKHRWELQVTDTNGPVTIGRGNFEIIKEIIV